MALTFPTLRPMDYKFKRTVDGYIREYAKDSSLKVPTVIDKLCLEYYILREKFIDKPTGQLLNDLCLKPLFGEFNNEVHGNLGIIDINDTSIYKYKWKFELTKIRNVLDSINIGICGELPPVHHSNGIPLWNGYQFYCTIYQDRQYILSNRNEKELIQDEMPKDGDIYELIVDIKNERVGICINNTNIAYCKPKDWRKISDFQKHFQAVPYRLNCSFQRDSIVKCIEFSIEQRPNDTDFKQYILCLYVTLFVAVSITFFS